MLNTNPHYAAKEKIIGRVSDLKLKINNLQDYLIEVSALKNEAVGYLASAEESEATKINDILNSLNQKQKHLLWNINRLQRELGKNEEILATL